MVTCEDVAQLIVLFGFYSQFVLCLFKGESCEPVSVGAHCVYYQDVLGHTIIIRAVPIENL